MVGVVYYKQIMKKPPQFLVFYTEFNTEQYRNLFIAVDPPYLVDHSTYCAIQPIRPAESNLHSSIIMVAVKVRPVHSSLLLVMGLFWIGMNRTYIEWSSSARGLTEQVQGVTTHHDPDTSQSISDALHDRMPSINNTIDNNNIPSGRQIVDNAYQNSFQLLETYCSKGMPIRSCFRLIQKQLQMPANFNMYKNHSLWSTHPWWFHTMMRDALPYNDTQKSNLLGFWHDLTFSLEDRRKQKQDDDSNNNEDYGNKTTTKLLRMCSIEKIGTKQWRKVQCGLNRPNQTTYKGQPCNIPKNQWPERKENIDKFVFLRDPLERFLSGFLDKCENPLARKLDPHCEPLTVFDSEEFTEGVVDHRRSFFEQYVDTMPLKWNMHFFPLSLYCGGLWRYLNDYSFVGYMGPDFYEDVYQFGQRYKDQTNLHQILNKVFKLDSKFRTNATSKENIGVETAAASFVQQYYTPKTVRKVLEYMSIDYVHLGLEIPGWAQEILDSEIETI